MSASPGKSQFSLIPRVVSYAFLVVLSTVLISAAFPPIFSSRSARAVVNAPVTALSTPISGRITYTETGHGAAPLAIVENQRVDRTTLINLRVEFARLERDLALNQALLPDLRGRLSDLEDELAAQRQADIVRSANDLKHARERLSLARFAAVNQKIRAARKLELHAKGIHPGTAEEIRNDIGLHDTRIRLAEVDVEIADTNLQYTKDGIFVGEDRQSLKTLQAEIRARKAELAQRTVETEHLAGRIADLRDLIEAEQERMELLRQARITADRSAIVHKTIAGHGSQVHAGDAVAEVLRCEDAFVVAIFSERQAHQLLLDAEVVIESSRWSASLKGTVSRLVPRTTTRLDRDYAVPFPPTERRELYAFIRPDPSELPTLNADGSCSVGTWVNVVTRREWVDKTRSYMEAGAVSLIRTTRRILAEIPSLPDAGSPDVARSSGSPADHVAAGMN